MAASKHGRSSPSRFCISETGLGDGHASQGACLAGLHVQCHAEGAGYFGVSGVDVPRASAGNLQDPLRAHSKYRGRIGNLARHHRRLPFFFVSAHSRPLDTKPPWPQPQLKHLPGHAGRRPRPGLHVNASGDGSGLPEMPSRASHLCQGTTRLGSAPGLL